VIGTRRDGSTFAKDHLYVLTAIGLYEWKWRRLEREIANLKLELIYDLRHTHHVSLDLSDCEIKSNWLRVPKEREKCSQFLHLLTKGQRLRLVDTYYRQIRDQKMILFGIVIDKRKLHAHTTQEILQKKAYELLLD
jgi:squalene cyclase